MRTACILSNCQNHPTEVPVFKFPFRKPELLAKWLEKIPKDLYIVIKNPSYICIDHFEDKLVRHGSDKTRLAPQAIPTIFNESKKKISQLKRKKTPIRHSDSNCRFCLRKFKENEKQVEINNYLRRQFSLITQTELKSSKVYSENVCEACFNAVRDSMTLRKKLLENQKTLEKAFGDFEDVKKESDGKKLDREISLDEKIIESVDVDKSWNENVAVKSEVLSDDEEKVPSISGLTVKNEDESHFEDFELMNDWPEVAYSNDSSDSDYFEPTVKLENTRKSSVKKELETVKTKVHKTLDTKKNVCEICGKYYATAISYKHHYDRIHLNIKNFACDVCGYQVYKKVELVGHLASHFKIRNHFCHLCTASFITRRALNQHFTKHKDKYDCVCGVNGCTSAFKSKDTLKQHQNEIHFKVHRHFCSECGKGFYRLSKMKQHQQSHFQPDPALAAKCPECHKVFKNTQSMKSHLKNYHGERKGTDCQYCGTTFSKSYFLKRHILTVHMKQKIMCQVAGCQKTFVRHEQYKSHIVKNHQDLGTEKVNLLIEGVKTVQVTYDCPEFKFNPS